MSGSLKVCPICKTGNELENQFCKRCGTRLAAPKRAGASFESPVPMPDKEERGFSGAMTLGRSAAGDDFSIGEIDAKTEEKFYISGNSVSEDNSREIKTAPSGRPAGAALTSAETRPFRGTAPSAPQNKPSSDKPQPLPERPGQVNQRQTQPIEAQKSPAWHESMRAINKALSSRRQTELESIKAEDTGGVPMSDTVPDVVTIEKPSDSVKIHALGEAAKRRMQTESGSGAFSSPSAEASDTMEEESDTLQMLPNSYLPETDASEEKPKGLRPPKSQQIELAKPKLPLNKSTIAHEAVYAPPKPAAPEEEMEVDLAPFLGRTAAYLLDLIFLTVPIILMIYLGLSAGGRKDPLQWIILYPARGALRDVLFFAFFWFVSYFTLFTWLGGATPGKMIMGLHTIDWFGRPPSFARALARSLYYFLDAATFFIGFLWAFFSANGQAFHDKLAGTLVVKDE